MSSSVRDYWKGEGGWGQVVNSQVVFSPELKTVHIHVQIDDRLMAFKTKPDQTIKTSVSKTHFVLFLEHKLISWPGLPLFDTMCNRYIRKLRTAKYLFLYLSVFYDSFLFRYLDITKNISPISLVVSTDAKIWSRCVKYQIKPSQAKVLCIDCKYVRFHFLEAISIGLRLKARRLYELNQHSIVTGDDYPSKSKVSLISSL